MLPSTKILSWITHHLFLNFHIASPPFHSLLLQWKHWHIWEVTTTYAKLFSCFGNQHLLFISGAGGKGSDSNTKIPGPKATAFPTPSHHCSCQEEYFPLKSYSSFTSCQESKNSFPVRSALNWLAQTCQRWILLDNGVMGVFPACRDGKKSQPVFRYLNYQLLFVPLKASVKQNSLTVSTTQP